MSQFHHFESQDTEEEKEKTLIFSRAEYRDEPDNGSSSVATPNQNPDTNSVISIIFQTYFPSGLCTGMNNRANAPGEISCLKYFSHG